MFHYWKLGKFGWEKLFYPEVIFMNPTVAMLFRFGGVAHLCHITLWSNKETYKVLQRWNSGAADLIGLA